MREELKLENIRSNLIRQEETIIFSLIERAQFHLNKKIYIDNAIKISNYNGPFMFFLLYETEKIHACVRRFTAPEEHPFSKNLPEPFLTDLNYDWPIKRTDINLNEKILDLYINSILPLICKDGDDNNYGSSAVCDVNVLQSLSKRIHYGKFVAETKYLNKIDTYSEYIKKNDKEKILACLTDKKVENEVLERVKIKASTYGQDPLDKKHEYKINPEIIQQIYFKWIIPLTKEVELLYLLKRNENER
jgi:chorismate mutase